MNNMYPETITWNPLGGECPHDCEYCYRKDLMRYPSNKVKYSGESRLVDVPIPKAKEGKVIFVCSMTDLFAKEIPSEAIYNVLQACCKVPNQYLFQTKNPARFYDFMGQYPMRVILGTTIETNRECTYQSKAPPIKDRFEAMKTLPAIKMVSIEPIMDFDLEMFVRMLRQIQPSYVSVGADSKNNGLKEPSKSKIVRLLASLRSFTEVRKKSNLSRLTK